MKYKRDISKSLWAEHSWGTKYLNLSRRTMGRILIYTIILIRFISIATIVVSVTKTQKHTQQCIALYEVLSK